MADEVLKKLLEVADVAATAPILTGKVTDVEMKVDTIDLSFTVEFPNVIPVKDISTLNNALKQKLIEKNYCENVNVSYKYENKTMSPELVKEYYRYYVEKLTSKKVIYRALDNFENDYLENEVKIYVGKTDKEVMEPLFNMIKKGFALFGIDFVKFTIEINAFLISALDTIKISRDEDVKRGAVEISIASPAPIKKEEKKEKTYKMKKQEKINGKPTPIKEIPVSESGIVEWTQKHSNAYFVIVGIVSNMAITTTKTGYRIYQATITDDTGSIVVKTFISPERNGLDVKYYEDKAGNGNKVRIYGYAEYDKFSRDVVIRLMEIVSNGIDESKINKKEDDAVLKRVELHAHSKMTFLDSVLDIKDYVNRAIEYGHTAIALTDKNTVQGLGELDHELEKINIKPIFGMEASFVDEDKMKLAFDTDNEDIDLKNSSYVVLDFETTGFSPNYHEIIEIGACKVENGVIVSEFSSFVNPRREISKKTTNLTTITNDDVRNAPFIEDILPKFMEYCKGSILVAHNAEFDSNHLYNNLRRINMYEGKIPFIDTLGIARARYNKRLKKFGLEDLCKAFSVTLDQHHRAIDDAKATALIFIKMLGDLFNDNIVNYKDINSCISADERYKYVHPSHLTILCKNRTGLVNLNRIVTDSNTTHFHKGPRTVKAFLDSHREGLLIGSGCFHGDVYETALKGTYEELLDTMDYYDYIEVQPPMAYTYIMKDQDINLDDVKNIIKLIIKAGREKEKIVVATSDVHELEKEHRLYRKMIYAKPLIGGGLHEYMDLEELPETHYRNTKEMLDEFSFLDSELAYQIVVKNTNIISDMIERYNLFPKQLFAPSDEFMKDFGVPSAKEDAIRIVYETAHQIYGDPLPKIVSERIEKELNSIIGNGYGSIYYIAYLLVKHSHDDGYVVGSRGSVGSSLVATLLNITEVNSLPPHYVCPNCHFSAFRYTQEQIDKYGINGDELAMQEELNEYDSGPDLPVKRCPHCNTIMNSDGFNIPFETFLGFEGDKAKVPDIDLNFSGEYQPKAHDFCREIFGVENTFRGGTIGTIARKTAENYINDYYNKNNEYIRKCEVDAMIPYIEGIKRQTGQHPGGIVVVPKGIDINEVTPVQYPADDLTSSWKTTHIDYHKFEANLLKLDILGHDDPTMIRFLMNYVEKYPDVFPFAKIEDVPINDKDVLRLFSNVEVLGVTPDLVKASIGSNGLPEFGTNLTKGMLEEIRPTTVAELIKISGLSHGTDVWNGNARDYFLGTKGNFGKIPFDNLIGCRDDIMVRLIQKGVPAKMAFKTMESVRKGRGLTPEMETSMRENGVEEWFIDCCKKIKYLFPKAHATAYVIMALRIAWFKVHRPIYYYSGFFSKRVDAFDVRALAGGYDAILTKINELSKSSNTKAMDEVLSGGVSEETSSVKTAKLLVGLQVALEMVARGYEFRNVHINKSHATDFVIEDEKYLRIPFVAIDSFGGTTAQMIVQNRGDVPFTSIKDATRRGHISNTLADKLDQLGAFEGLPRDDEIGLFKFMS